MTPSPPYTHRTASAFAGLVALVVTVLVTLAFPATAAASACGDKVLNDWFDNGRVDRIYPTHCYADAIDAIPKDLEPYIDAQESISRALQFALRKKIAPGGIDPSPDGPSDRPKKPSDPKDPDDPRVPGDPRQTAPEVDTSGASSVPVPLFVLGGMSLALLGAGGLGYLSRRRQAARTDDSGDGDTVA